MTQKLGGSEMQDGQAALLRLARHARLASSRSDLPAERLLLDVAAVAEYEARNLPAEEPAKLDQAELCVQVAPVLSAHEIVVGAGFDFGRLAAWSEANCRCGYPLGKLGDAESVRVTFRVHMGEMLAAQLVSYS